MRMAWILTLLTCAACAVPTPSSHVETLPGRELAPLPEAVANNAVAALRHGDRELIFSFLGLGNGKTWRDTRSSAWLLERDLEGSGVGRWRQLADVPGPAGRLAATAVSARGAVYLFGGYTVAEDHSEKSVPLVHRLDPDTLGYTELPPMPVPVDDAVAVVYADRYIYLVSGWHDTDNVDLVQVLDLETLRWSQATAYPAPPVFGHAGGISGNTLLICDGVKVVPLAAGKREFRASRVCVSGQISPADPNHITWRSLDHPPGPARYRMAATGSEAGRIYFAGGSSNPYNYSGIGYDGAPSAPSREVFAYDLTRNQWSRLADLPFASMDHRGLLALHDGFLLVGGMGQGQKVLDRTLLLDLE